MTGEFVVQPTQRFTIVDVVPFRKQRGSKSDFRGALACAAQHGISPPFDFREQLPVRMFQSDEVVAAITGRAKNQPLARSAQRFDGLNQETSWQRRAIAID